MRLVQAGKLLPIEQALAGFGGSGAPPSEAPPPAATPRRSGPSPFERDAARRNAAPSAPEDAPRSLEPRASSAPSGGARESLHRRLSEMGHAHLADAVENSRIEAAGADLRIVTSKVYKRYFSDPAVAGAVLEVFGKPLRLNITVEEGEPPAAPLAAPVAQEDETMARALANPEVQRFQQVFEGSRIYKVRNLKEQT